jgi:hypothetical protein
MANNRTGAKPNWFNNHEYSIAYGGPIVKNKTFFYVLWDQQIHKERTLVDGSVLTDTARQGIFRYFDGWNPTTFDTAQTANAASVATRVSPAVDIYGNPVAPLQNANGSPYTGAGLLCFSVFGSQRINPSTGGWCRSPPQTARRHDYFLTGSAWDAGRPAIDATGYIFNETLKNMPHADYFGRPVSGGLTPDGLNTASYAGCAARR